MRKWVELMLEQSAAFAEVAMTVVVFLTLHALHEVYMNFVNAKQIVY